MSREDDIRANHIYYDSSSQADIAWLLAELASVREERDATVGGVVLELDVARARVAQLEAALKFYADEGSWYRIKGVKRRFPSHIDMDQGTRARALLASQPLPKENKTREEYEQRNPKPSEEGQSK